MSRRFVLDVCLAPRLADVLSLCLKNVEVVHLSKHADYDTADQVWLEKIAQWRPRAIVLTADAEMSRREAEAAELKNGGITAIFLTSSWMGMKFNEQTWRFLRCWPKLIDVLDEYGNKPVLIRADVRGNKFELM